MSNLLDIADVPRVVETSKYGELNVHGLSVEGLAYLIKKHPDLFKVFDAKGNRKFEIDQVIDLGVEVFSEFLAAGLGYPGNSEGYADAVERCKKINPEDAWAIGQAILEESFPGGAANFFERVAKAMNSAEVLKDASKSPSEAEKAESAETKAS